MHPCFVQYGDLREALARRARGEPETYRAQDYSIDWIKKGGDGARRVHRRLPSASMRRTKRRRTA